MKMELVLSAPQDCVVQQWHVAAGDSVTEGQVAISSISVICSCSID
jgi:biotin carboxyl carrier protein